MQQELRGSDPEHGSDVIRVKFGEGIAGTVAKTGGQLRSFVLSDLFGISGFVFARKA